MPVYLFTLHAYRSWMPDHPRGYVRIGHGILAPDRAMARCYAARARGPELSFDAAAQRAFICAAHDACGHHHWHLHAAGTGPTHLHFLTSWTGFLDWKLAQDRLKNSLSYVVNQRLNCPGRRWCSGKGSHKRVTGLAHFRYLVDEYLPGQRGISWCEGQPLPDDNAIGT